MILLDTSVWIEVFRRRAPLDLEALADLDELVTCLPVVQEVLQGFREERAFRLARESMLSFPIVDSPLPRERFLAAAEIYRRCRTEGISVRSSVDCLIAASAVEHDLEVVHRDRDYRLIARAVPLRERNV